MSEYLQEYQNILVGIDGSDQARQAFETAIEVAKRNEARVVIVHAVENKNYSVLGVPNYNADVTQNEVDQLQEVLDDYQAYAHERGIQNVVTEIIFGSPKQVMVKQMPQKYQVDLIMCGQSGLNAVERLMMGSVSEYITRNAPCDVLVVRCKDKKKKDEEK